MKKSPDPKAPIVITTGKPKSKAPAKPKRPKKHKLQPGQHPAEVSPVFTTQQMRVLDLLATGSSMAAAAEVVGLTHWALQKWMQRDKVFRYYADRARGIHTSDIYDAFHEVETDARVFLHEVIRDHDVKPHIRLRAALAALNRKTEDWLPRPIFLATPFLPPTISDTNDQSGPAIAANGDSVETNGAANANSPQRTETEPPSLGEGPGSRLDQANGQSQPTNLTDDADKNATHADKTENLHLTANQSLPLETPNFCPPKISANADKTSPETAPTEARPSGWAHNETSRSSPTEIDTADIKAGERSAAAQSPQGASIDSPGRSERSEREPGEKQPSEARPPQPPVPQNAPGATIAAYRDSCHTETEPSSSGEGPGSRLDRAECQWQTNTPVAISHADKIATHLRGERETGEQSETARIDIVNGERSDAAQSPKGASVDSPGRSERSEREPGESQPSEARPPQPPVPQNAPGATIAAYRDSCHTETEPSSLSEGLGSRLDHANGQPPIHAADHADKNTTHADKTENLHLTANQSLPSETPNFCPPRISANADITSPETAPTKAQSSGWAHNETSRSRYAENAFLEGETGERSAAAPSPKGASIDSPGRSERSEREPGEKQPSEARPPQPPATQNTPGTTIAANSDSCDTEPEPSSLGEGPGSRLDHAIGQPPIYVADHADKNAIHADKTETLHLTANQSLRSKTPNFCPPTISATADKTSPETAPTEARPLGWAHNETSRNSNADNNATHIDDIPGPAILAPLRQRPKANPQPPAPEPGEDVTMRLDTAFFTKYTVLRHENPKDFAHLLGELTSIYEPQSKAEELQVLRIAQAHWNLRRIDTMQTAVLDSTVGQIRCTVPDVHPAAAIASKFLGTDPSDQVWFLDRMHHYRRFHDEYLERQENRLFRLQERRAYAPIRQAKLALLQPRRQEIGPFPTRQARLTHLADASFQNQLTATEAQCKPTHGEKWD